MMCPAVTQQGPPPPPPVREGSRLGAASLVEVRPGGSGVRAAGRCSPSCPSSVRSPAMLPEPPPVPRRPAGRSLPSPGLAPGGRSERGGGGGGLPLCRRARGRVREPHLAMTYLAGGPRRATSGPVSVAWRGGVHVCRALYCCALCTRSETRFFVYAQL